VPFGGAFDEGGGVDFGDGVAFYTGGYCGNSYQEAFTHDVAVVYTGGGINICGDDGGVLRKPYSGRGDSGDIVGDVRIEYGLEAVSFLSFSLPFIPQ
jgi:hypothetical protein